QHGSIGRTADTELAIFPRRAITDQSDWRALTFDVPFAAQGGGDCIDYESGFQLTIGEVRSTQARVGISAAVLDIRALRFGRYSGHLETAVSGIQHELRMNRDATTLAIERDDIGPIASTGFLPTEQGELGR